jgi:hypothetical protein
VDSWWIPGGIDTCSKNVRDPKLPRNSWHSWRIPGGFLEELTLVQKILRNPNYPGIPGIPGGIDTCSKNIEKPKLPRNSWRN